MNSELEPRIKMAFYIASTASGLIRDLFHKTLKTEGKISSDFATDLENSIESMSIKNIQSLFPDDGFTAEQGNDYPAKNEYTWVVDPLDGKENFLRGLPLCGFQLAIMNGSSLVYSVIVRPFTQEWFTATAGSGAFYENQLTSEKSMISVSQRALEESMVIFDSSIGRSDNPSTQLLGSLADEVSVARSFGSATFDLPAVAAGVAEVLITGIAKLTDIAAGTLLVREAGGEVYDLKGETPNLDADFMIFSSKTLQEPLLKAIRSYV